MRLLLAEDDQSLQEVLVRGLHEAGYVVDGVEEGSLAIDYFKLYSYSVAILDWKLPDISGLEVLKWVRKMGIATPILVLTARDAPRDRVLALDEGADDYLIKPFHFEELLARLRALLRRPGGDRDPILKVGSLTYDPAMVAIEIHGKRIDLPPREFSILGCLIRNYPNVTRRRAIALAGWPEESDTLGSNTIDVHIARLRSKLVASDVKVETVRGVGYRLVRT
ncbi:MAG: response regulator transcription factor [Acidimicrobiales bacterium]|nr:response regulator transcription factor [Acidimicrobiales bacterium]